jgi:hypothetical protein
LLLDIPLPLSFDEIILSFAPKDGFRSLSVGVLSGGLISSAVAVDAVKSGPKSLAVFILGVMGTFGVVWLIGNFDYAVRLAWYKRHEIEEVVETAPERSSESGEFFWMLFLRLVTLVIVTSFASLVFKVAGDKWGGIAVVFCVLVLVILNGGRRL